MNKAVEPVTDDKRGKLYPLYIQVTYNRKNMQFRSHYGEYYQSLDGENPSLMKFEEKAIQRIITYEVGKTKGEYDLKGLKRKYAIYSISILLAVEAYLKPKLRLSVLKTNNELSHALNFTQPRVTTKILYKAVQLLFPDVDTYVSPKLQDELNAYGSYVGLYKGPILTYNFPTIIEWLDGSYKAGLATQLDGIFKNKPGELNGVVALLDQAVKQSLKALEG